MARHPLEADLSSADGVLNTALDALQSGEGFLAVLDSLPAAIYLTDKEGVITYFNSACTKLAGRTPVVGRESWCVTWKIYTTNGEFLPHDQCPMAVAIRERRAIRGVEAVAERPDGTRVNFVPYPTPLFDGAGNLVGAVNMLIDVTEQRQQARYLHDQAGRCRRLADASIDQQTVETLTLMSVKYDERALKLRHSV